MNMTNTPNLTLVSVLVLALSGMLTASRASAQTSQAVNAGPPSFVRATRMIGREIVDASGEVFGEVEEYVVDGSGQAFAVIAMGGFLGIAESEVLVPHALIGLSASAPELLAYRGDAAQLRTAPVFKPENDALRSAAAERKLLLKMRKESTDVSEAERVLQTAREKLEKEQKELRAVEKAKQNATAIQ